MSNDERLEWFPCKPGPLLGALAGMSSPEQHVYLIVLLRIYENGGACPDTISALSVRTRLNKRVVAEALESLFQSKRLYRGDGGIRNPKADSVIATSWAVVEKRKIGGAEGGRRAAQNRKKNQSRGDTSPAQEPKKIITQEQIQIQDSLFPDGNRAPEPARESAAMKDPPLDPEADYYRRGKEVLGPSAGGMLTQLLKAKGGNVALARAAIEQASTRGDAKQYVGAMVRGVNGGGANGANRNGGEQKLGFAGIAAKLRQANAERADGAAAFGDAGDRQPEDGRGFAAAPLGGMDRTGQTPPFAPSPHRR